LIFGATPPATTRAAAAEAIAGWGGRRLVRGKKTTPRADRDEERPRVLCRAGARARQWSADAIRNPLWWQKGRWRLKCLTSVFL
jgi:hypothetical protein